MKLQRLTLVFAQIALSACVMSALTPVRPETPPVEDSAQEYNNDLRWGRWHEAAERVEPERRNVFLGLMDDNVNPYRFTSVEVIHTEAKSSDGTEIDLLVALEYYRLPSVEERKVRQLQHWRYDVPTKKWVVTPDLSVLREDVSGIGPK
ncbi:MAG: hypothetical protein ACHQ6T_16555 [Myxococcota bacterium]